VIIVAAVAPERAPERADDECDTNAGKRRPERIDLDVGDAPRRPRDEPALQQRGNRQQRDGVARDRAEAHVPEGQDAGVPDEHLQAHHQDQVHQHLRDERVPRARAPRRVDEPAGDDRGAEHERADRGTHPPARVGAHWCTLRW
jgi:hypothetical protein